MKAILTKIFALDEPAAIAATVRRRLRPGRYELVDDATRVIQADSPLNWQPGTRVTVQSGRIVDLAATLVPITTYEV